MLTVRLLNFVLYQVGWLACVLGAAFARPWLGIAIALILVAMHLWLATDRPNQVKILAIATAIGLLVDSFLLALGVFSFPNGYVVAWLPPVWMSVLWMQFATTFRYCLEWLSGQYAVSAFLALVGAPLAFLGGERVGAVSFSPPRFSHLIMLATVWCVAMPVLIYASDRIHSGCDSPATYRGFKT